MIGGVKLSAYSEDLVAVINSEGLISVVSLTKES